MLYASHPKLAVVLENHYAAMVSHRLGRLRDQSYWQHSLDIESAQPFLICILLNKPFYFRDVNQAYPVEVDLMQDLATIADLFLDE